MYKQIILTIVLVFCIAAGSSAQEFSDITDDKTAEAVAVLSSLGIVSGDVNGNYNPDGILTRAQFCKLAVLAEGHGDQIKSSAYRTLFSDVPATDWAAPYVNLAYEEGLVSGYGNGLFGAEDPVTVAQAVTVVLHLLGYSNDMIGPFWPEDYLDKAASLGLLEEIASEESLTRGDAAKLFYAMLQMTTADGKEYISSLAAATLSDAVLLDCDAEAEDGTLHTVQVYTPTVGISWYSQANSLSEELEGYRGTLLLNQDGDITGFLPSSNLWRELTPEKIEADSITDTNGMGYSVRSDTAVIVDGEKKMYGDCWYDLVDRDTVRLYYSASSVINLITASDLNRYDEVLLTGYYEAATPNTAYPTEIKLLGLTLSVAEGAEQSLQQFNIGDKITVKLNGAGEVNYAYSPDVLSADLIGLVKSATASTCTIELTSGLTVSGAPASVSTASALVGSLARVSAGKDGTISVAGLGERSVGAQLDIKAQTLGSLPLSSDIKLYDRVGQGTVTEVALSDLLFDTVPASQISYFSTNTVGEVNLLLLSDVTGNAYTYGILHKGSESGGESNLTYTNDTLSVENASGTSQAYLTGSRSISDKTVGGLAFTADGRVAGVKTLVEVSGITRSAFDFEAAVTVDGLKIPISDAVQIHNTATGQWTTLAAAKSFSDSFTVYYSGTPGQDAQVRVIMYD